MTTIFAIRTNTGEDAVVLAADRLISEHLDKKFVRKDEKPKIRKGKHYATAFSGNYDEDDLQAFFNYIAGQIDFENFLKQISDKKQPLEAFHPSYILLNSTRARKYVQQLHTGKVAPATNMDRAVAELLKSDPERKLSDLEKFMLDILRSMTAGASPVEVAITYKVFAEFELYNRYLCKRDGTEEYNDGASELILAVNKPSLGLYRIDPSGNVVEAEKSRKLEWICMGSGSEYANEYLREQRFKEDPLLKDKINADNVNIYTALTLARRCMLKASRDAKTGDVSDIFLVTKDKIEDVGSPVRDEIERLADLKYDERFQQLSPRREENP